MSSNFNWRAVAAFAIALLLGFGAANAQQTSGNVFVTVTDNSGEALPGVRVSLSGNGAPQTQFSDAQGQVRFLGLAPGSYQVGAELQGFSTVEYPDVRVNVGRNTTIDLKLAAAVEETITVTSESPLLDERKVSAGTSVTQVELEKIPTARDPWVILQSVPGVLVDRVNVGGNESGQQSNFTGPGVGSAQASWSVDGVVITDPAARGSSPTYYNFDAFDEMAISTGGSDVGAMTAGVQLNLVTKRGTNQWRAEGRYLVTDESWQSTIDVDQGDGGKAGLWNAGTSAANQTGNRQAAITAGASTESVDDYGFEIGGPIVKDRLWIWGTYGVQDIVAFQLGSSLGPIPDNTELESYAAKLNAQITSSNSAIAFYHFGDKQKQGRGAAPDRPVPTTWNQVGPTDIYKLEDTQIFNSNLYLTGNVSYVGGGFELIPIGGEGANAPEIVRGTDRVWNNTFFGYHTERPQEQAKIDGSYFFNTGAVNHELKFGVGYRHNEVSSESTYPGRGIVGRKELGANYGPLGNAFLGVVYHDVFVNDEFEQWNLQLQDTLTWGNVTLNAGIRYDLQEPMNGEVTQPASRFAPNLITAFTRPAGDPGFEWKSISPRLGLTYALGEERDTLLRASYARFVDQLGTGFFATLGVKLQQYAYVYFVDPNNNNRIDAGEIISPAFGLTGDRTQRANAVDPGLDPSTTDEIILGIEHALAPEFVIGLQATLRETNDAVVSESFVFEGGQKRVIRAGDFTQAGWVEGVLPNGRTFREPVFKLRPGVTRDPARGSLTHNIDSGSEYTGLAFTFNKRLANRWMLRGFINYSDWTNNFGDGVIKDPTRGVNSVDGSQVLVQSAGSGTKADVWINSTWSYNISGMYQIAPDRPWGFNVSADLNGREGFANPYRVSIAATSALTADTFARTVLVTPDNDTFRNDDIHLLNLRVEKEFSFGDFGLIVGVDAFNVTNDATVLQRQGIISARGVFLNGNQLGTNGSAVDFASTRGDHVNETVSPRILRLGARLSWN